MSSEPKTFKLCAATSFRDVVDLQVLCYRKRLKEIVHGVIFPQQLYSLKSSTFGLHSLLLPQRDELCVFFQSQTPTFGICDGLKPAMNKSMSRD